MTRRTNSVLFYAACAMVAVLSACAIIFEDDLTALVANARAGCFPWAPAEVEWPKGSPPPTLCPGQFARQEFIIIIRDVPPGDDI
jgi:hypothetical protein